MRIIKQKAKKNKVQIKISKYFTILYYSEEKTLYQKSNLIKG